MISYMQSWDGIVLNSGFGHNRVQLSRSVAPSKARILGGASYDLDGMYTYPSEQTYTASFVDRNSQINTPAMFQRLGRYGWLVAVRKFSPFAAQNWAKLISIDSGYEPNDISGGDINKYTLTFACSPFWYDTTDSTSSLTLSPYRTVTNNGNARSNWVTLYITSAISSPLEIDISRSSGATYGTSLYGSVLYDGSGYQTIMYNASKSVNDTLAIDMRKNTVLVNNVDAYSNVSLPATQIDLGYLYPGDTRFTFSQAVTGQIVYRGAYV